ncbi:hypothetical protein ACMFMF_010868 [Clarireedia jacksonii]
MPQQISYRPTSDSPTPTYNLIFFITGNPGLIGYYAIFLKKLHERLSSSSTKSSNTFHIFGQSLAGLETNEEVAEDPSIPQKLYSLEEQIEYVRKALVERMHDVPDGSTGYKNVILIGHSVGSYILLEILTRLTPEGSLPTPPPLLSGILLFPTVTHISASPSGTKFALLSSLPGFPLLASSAAKGLLYLAPNRILDFLIPKVTGMPPPAAKVTRDFLRSRAGVHQALYLAKDEMETITEDRWNEDIWGLEAGGGGEERRRTPRLVFYFGRNDHWVADHTRDALIAARGLNGVVADEESVSFSGEGGSKPIMMIDREGIDHSFCVHSSEPMAEKVSRWVQGITGCL